MSAAVKPNSTAAPGFSSGARCNAIVVSPVTNSFQPGDSNKADKSNNLPVQFLVAIIPSGTTYTRIATWCVEPLFHETQPTFEKIVTSYHSDGIPTLAQLAKP
jgi:hypothetical protein